MQRLDADVHAPHPCRMPMTTLTVRIDPETLRVLEEITGNLKAAVKLLDTNAQLLAKLLRCRLKLT